MKITAVLVDEFPASCGECPLGVNIGCDANEYVCAALPKETRNFPFGFYLPELNFRRHDCPLRLDPIRPIPPIDLFRDDVCILKDAPSREGDM